MSDSPTGITVFNEDIMRSTRVTDEEFRRVEARERGELDRRLLRVRAVAPAQSIDGRSVVIVDDGIATGATVRAAVSVARANGARDVTVATPVAPSGVPQMLRSGPTTSSSRGTDRSFGGRGTANFAAVGEGRGTQLLAAAHRRGR